MTEGQSQISRRCNLSIARTLRAVESASHVFFSFFRAESARDRGKRETAMEDKERKTGRVESRARVALNEGRGRRVHSYLRLGDKQIIS
jgi:hypothetical protein